MPAYLVTLSDQSVVQTLNGQRNFVVFASTANQARDSVRAQFGNDYLTSQIMTDATATEIAAATDWAVPGLWNFRVKFTKPNGVVLADVTVASSAGDNTIDEIAALLVTALNGTALDNASYNGTTNVLTVSSAGDNFGDHSVEVWAWPASGAQQDGVSGGFFGTITHRGSAGSACTVALAADATVPPVFYAGIVPR